MKANLNEIEEVYRRYGASVHRRCMRIVRDESMAEDALQDVFVRLMRYGADLSHQPSTLRWLHRVAERCCYDLLRKSRRRLVQVQSEQDYGSAQQEAPADERAVNRDTVMRIWARLRKRPRAVAVLYYIDELSQEEIASRLGCTRKTVYHDLKRIEQAVQRHLKRGGPP